MGSRLGAVAPITLPAGESRLTLNGDGLGEKRVEVAQGRFGLIPEFSGANAGGCGGDGGLDRAVGGPRASLAAVAGETVRLRLHLARGADPEPRLFAACLSC